MKLIIKRDQDKGFLGGTSFIISFHVELTPEESELIKKYKAHKEPLTYREKGGVEKPELKIGDLVDGVGYKAKDITTLLNIEGLVKEACQSFKDYLEVMASFGGEKVIEYNE